MPRKARKEQEGQYFHVLVEGIGNEEIFGTDLLKETYLLSMSRARDKFPTRILAYCIMDCYAHVLVAVENVAELTNYFKRVNSEFAIRYNHKMNRSGYVFVGRFKSELISDDKSLIHYANEIHKLCLKAGIAEHQSEYTFSSYRNFLTGDGILNLKNACRLLGSAKKIIESADEPTDHNIKMLEHNEPKREDKKAVIKELYKRHHITNNYGIRNSHTCRAIALELRERTGASIREMANLLGIGRETLRKWIKTEQPELIKVTEPIRFG